MALGFEIKGKTLVKSAASILGQTGNDDQIRVVPTKFVHEVNTSESGPNIPAAIFNAGLSAIITIPFSQWDQAVIDTLVKAQGGTDDGDLGVLGQALVLFPIQLLPTVTGSIQYTFPTCYVTGDQPLENFGVLPAHKRIVAFKAIPDPTALGVATTPLFTSGAV